MSTASPKAPEQDLRIPERSFGSIYGNPNLRSSVSIVGLGCSSFSTFFWSAEEWEGVSPEKWSVASLEKSHRRVQEWIRTIEYAVLEAGITLLDTAPWYGHGTSEVVIGWAMEELSNRDTNFLRENLTINTKVGRYEAEPSRQFDFSAAATLESVQRSLQRLQCCGYIDVLQLHDPEFAPSMEILFQETIPAMLKCQEKGWCRALGMTGYPLEVQHQILQLSMEVYKRNIWDQSLTYCHFNLHDGSLMNNPIGGFNSFADYCGAEKMLVLGAAPLSMGLLTERGPPQWHPASDELKLACAQAADICRQHGVEIATLALLAALSHPGIPCTIVGMGSVAEVQKNCSVARRFCGVEAVEQGEILSSVLLSEERKAWEIISDTWKSPFAILWKNGGYKWDGVKEAQNFWKKLHDHRVVNWQRPMSA